MARGQSMTPSQKAYRALEVQTSQMIRRKHEYEREMRRLRHEGEDSRTTEARMLQVLQCYNELRHAVEYMERCFAVGKLPNWRMLP